MHSLDAIQDEAFWHKYEPWLEPSLLKKEEKRSKGSECGESCFPACARLHALHAGYSLLLQEAPVVRLHLPHGSSSHWMGHKGLDIALPPAPQSRPGSITPTRPPGPPRLLWRLPQASRFDPLISSITSAASSQHITPQFKTFRVFMFS